MKKDDEQRRIFARKALEWFITIMGKSEWNRRRKNVVDYFHSINSTIYAESEIQSLDFAKLFKPIAVYSDWIAWYLYLIESIFERPACHDPSQATRIFPFFVSIGRNLDALRKMSGVERRFKAMINENQNQPDSILYELAVALLYHRNGWKVTFLEELLSQTTPDFEVSKGGKKYWVECKRLAKVPDYAERERQAWQTRARHLFNAMRIARITAYAEVIFKVPIEQTNEMILGGAFTSYEKLGKINDSSLLVNEQIEFRAYPINMTKVNGILTEKPVRPTSPDIIQILTGKFDPHGNYLPLLAPHRIDKVCPDDELYVLNEFYGELHYAYVAKWECIAKESIDRKAKDIKKILSNALKQIPTEGKGIIHIGYETVMGPFVEVERHKKIKDTISKFVFGNKKITSIYCNTMQFLPNPNGFECAETTIYFEQNPSAVLHSNLLFDLPGTISSDSPHWEEDLAAQNR